MHPIGLSDGKVASLLLGWTPGVRLAPCQMYQRTTLLAFPSFCYVMLSEHRKAATTTSWIAYLG